MRRCTWQERSAIRPPSSENYSKKQRLGILFFCPNFLLSTVAFKFPVSSLKIPGPNMHHDKDSRPRCMSVWADSASSPSSILPFSIPCVRCLHQTLRPYFRTVDYRSKSHIRTYDTGNSLRPCCERSEYSCVSSELSLARDNFPNRRPRPRSRSRPQVTPACSVHDADSYRFRFSLPAARAFPSAFFLLPCTVSLGSDKVFQGNALAAELQISTSSAAWLPNLGRIHMPISLPCHLQCTSLTPAMREIWRHPSLRLLEITGELSWFACSVIGRRSIIHPMCGFNVCDT
ncbi:hypothetical protein FB451DRAFT_395565 [Mycena latifolia]|nr:hypothetical protein FB451DRAFT_395565 [Mycena latifolia]